MIAISVLLEKLEKCYLPKLARDLELSEKHSEFDQWDKNLIEHFATVINLFNEFNLKECSGPEKVLSSLLLLYFQLHSEGQWKTKKCEECAQKLNYQFQLKYDSTLTNLLKTNKVYDPQKVFDACMVTLHKKLSPDDIKKYPALIEAYYFIVMDLEGYDISLNPASVLPISLLLIEDYVIENRLKGLKCCSSIVQSLTMGHFLEGNYYEVVYRVLKKVLSERNVDVTKLVLECLADLLRSLPLHSKVTTIDEVIGIILEQMYTETNLYRKKEFFIFLNKIIHIHGVHCVKRNLFLPVICDNLEICSNKFVGEIILLDVLECLENWIKYCWCVWKLSQNQKLMTTLIKILYISCKDETVATKIFNNFTALCKLCSAEEQKEIVCDLEKSIQATKNKNEMFTEILEEIKNHITEI